MGWLANILPAVLLSCPHESRQVPDTKPLLHRNSTEMPEIAPKSVRLCSFHLEKFRDRVKISRNQGQVLALIFCMLWKKFL